MGLLSYLQSVVVTAWATQSPFSTTPVTDTPTHSREPSVLLPVVSVEDGVSVSRDIIPSSSSSRLCPSAVATTATAAPPVVNGSAGTRSPSKGEASKAFGSSSAQTPTTNPSSTAASSTAALSPTPSNASTAATSSAVPPRRKLDANKLFQAPTSFAPQQVGSPRLGHQPPVMQHQQQQPPGPVLAPGQMPGQPPYPPQQMQIEWKQPQYGGWQPQYPQSPYMNPEWYSHMQHPHMHQHPHQPPYVQPPDAPHQPFAQSLPPAQQTPTTATMSPGTGPMPALPPPSSSTPVPHPNVPQINTSVPPSTPATPPSAPPTTSLTPSATEFVTGSMSGPSPTTPSPGFPLPKNSIRISNPNTGEAVVLRPPDVGHTRNLSRDTATVHESSPLRKVQIRTESPLDKKAPSLSRTASASSVATPASASPKPGSTSFPPKPILPPIATGGYRPRMQRPVPGPLDLSSTQQRAPLTPRRPSVLASARKIDDLDRVTYPVGIKAPSVELNQGQAKGGKYKYDRDFLLQFMQVCKDKPDNLGSLDALGIERGAPGDDNGGPFFGSGGRAQGRRMTSMGPPGPNRSASLNMGLGLNFPGGKNAPTPFGSMGNFSSTPSRLTSEERFAQSNNGRDRAVSGSSAFMRNNPISRSSSEGGVGGPNAVPPSSREANRTRSQRGRARNDSLKPNASQLSQQQQQQQEALSGLEPVPASQQSENRWSRIRLHVDENSPEFVERKVKGLLNKLTLENFDSVSNQIIGWANKSENEKNGATLILVIKLVFEKATDEAYWSEMYARLCRKMMEQISGSVQDDNIWNNAGEPIVGGHLFRKYLLNRCQEDFERGWSQKESAQAAAALKAADDKAAAEAASKANGDDKEPVLYSDEYYAFLKAKRQSQGLVRFFGELFKLQMLTERIMHECIKRVLKIDNPEEEEIESLCTLLTTVGQTLDTPKAKGHMNIYFGRMQILVDNPNVALRIRYMVLDVIELRGRNWRPRNAAAGPSTIAQFAKVNEEEVVEQVYEEEVDGQVYEEEVEGQPVNEEEPEGQVNGEEVDGQGNAEEVEVSHKRKRPHRGGKTSRTRKHKHQTDKGEEVYPAGEDQDVASVKDLCATFDSRQNPVAINRHSPRLTRL
ncbi:hypothetical protein FRC04_008616 [Tulasnella sp. 424]|nr:hypothetical protein FRC04_008616 [Tulasnella sp. 424]